MSRAKILIVEDESLVARDIQGMLQGLGYSVTDIVATGKDAVQAAAEKKPDLILMDIVLKSALDGISAASAIRQSQDVPIIYLTAFADQATLERVKKTHPQGYLLKPFEQQALNTAIELALYKHGEETKLKTSERWFSSILDHFGNAIITCDDSGLITFMNPLAETLTGWAQGEALGKPFPRVVRLLRSDSGKPLAVPIKKLPFKVNWEAPVRCWLPDKSGAETLVDIHATFARDEKTAVSHLIFVLRKTSRNDEDEKRLAFTAICDPLTGLPNRILFEDRLDLDIARSARKGQKAAVALFSLTAIKEVRTRFARDEEDMILQKAAARISRSIRASDTVARFGWNEFILLLTDVSGREAAAEITQRIQTSLEKGIQSGGRRINLGSTFAMAVYPDDGETPRSLIEKVETSLWQARTEKSLKNKKAGGRRSQKSMAEEN